MARGISFAYMSCGNPSSIRLTSSSVFNWLAVRIRNMVAFRIRQRQNHHFAATVVLLFDLRSSNADKIPFAPGFTPVGET